MIKGAFERVLPKEFLQRFLLGLGSLLQDTFERVLAKDFVKGRIGVWFSIIVLMIRTGRTL